MGTALKESKHTKSNINTTLLKQNNDVRGTENNGTYAITTKYKNKTKINKSNMCEVSTYKLY